MNPSRPADHSLESLGEGTRAEHRYVITEACHRALTETFGDVSPVHVDDDFARRAGFEERVMHGAILNGFVSHFVGVVLPGIRSLLLSVDIRYLAPTHLGDEIRIEGKVVQRVESQRVVVLSLSVANVTRGRPAARARVQVRVSDAI
ncbi:MAG TPA: MaoC/PaaZ C-terminal domain-containing protein [Polyangiaceae bacterium]